jgi:hypothetical protein
MEGKLRVEAYWSGTDNEYSKVITCFPGSNF